MRRAAEPSGWGALGLLGGALRDTSFMPLTLYGPLDDVRVSAFDKRGTPVEAQIADDPKDVK